MTLSARQLRFLRGLGHKLHPVVTIADRGLTPNVINELDAALRKHELIKVRIRADRTTRTNWLNEIETRCAAQRVHVIGQVACFFRRNTRKPVITLPASV